MSKVISLCDCEHIKCKTFDTKKNVHVGDECYHPNNNHHKTGIDFVKRAKRSMDADLNRRHYNWGV